MIATIVPCVTAAVLCYSPTIRPITPERAQELLRILEIPTRALKEGNRPGPPEGVPPVRFFRFHADEIRALGMAGPTTIPPLLALFEDQSKHPQVRTQAAAALVLHLAGVFCEVDPRVLGAVRAALKDRDPAVRAGTLAYIAVLGKRWNRGNPVLPHPFKTSMSPATLRVIFPDIVAALGDPDWEVVANAADAMKHIGEIGQGVPELLTALKRNEPEVWTAAMYTLTIVGVDDPAVLKAFLSELTQTADLARYSEAVWHVGAFGARAKDAVPLLIQALKDPRGRAPMTTLYIYAIASLGKIGPDSKAAAPVILEYQKTSNLSSNDHIIIMNALEQIDLTSYKIARDVYYDVLEKFKKQM